MENNITNNYNELCESVFKRMGIPVNKKSVMVTIEAHGVSVRNVDLVYGCDLETLTDRVYERLVSENKPKENEYFLDEKSHWAWFTDATRQLVIWYYPKVMLSLLPLLIQLLGIAVGGFALWVYLPFSILETTVVYLALICSMIFTGGYEQLFGRHVSMYYEVGRIAAYRKKFYSSLINALGIVALASGTIYGANVLFDLYPSWIVRVGLVYTFLISALILVLAPLYVFRKVWYITIAFIVGLAMGLMSHQLLGFGIYYAHWISVVATIVPCLLFFEYHLKQRAGVVKSSVTKIRSAGLAARVYNGALPFFYGTLFYVFGYIDRILAWSAGDIPYHITFNYEYEIGVDIALFVNLLVHGTVLKFCVSKYNRFLVKAQKSISPANSDDFNGKFRVFYFRHLFLVLTQSMGISLIIGLILHFHPLTPQYVSDRSIEIFMLCSFGYNVFMWGLVNALFIFRLNNFRLPSFAMVCAIVTNVIVGYFASRYWSYELSILGMIAGATVFSMITYFSINRYFKRLDYYLYCAY